MIKVHKDDRTLILNPLLRILAIITVLSLFNACDSSKEDNTSTVSSKQQLLHPEVDHIYDINGVSVNNKYHWLSDPNNESYIKWEDQQSDTFQQYLDDNKYESFIEAQSNESIASYTLTQKLGYHYFMLKEPKLSNNQWALAIYNGITQAIEVINIETTNEESIIDLSISTTGRYTALLFKNLTQYQWRIYDTFSKKFTFERLPWLNHRSNLVWNSSTEFIYAGTDEIYSANIYKNKNRTLFSAKEQLENISDWTLLNLHLTHINKQFLITIRNSINKDNRGWVIDLNNSEVSHRNLISNVKADLEFAGSRKNNYYFITNLSAPRNRIIAINIEKPERRYWQETLAQSSAVLLNAKLLNNHWLLFLRDNAQSQLKVSNLNGANVKQLPIAPYSEIAINNISFYTQETHFPLVNIQTLTEKKHPFQIFELDNEMQISPILPPQFAAKNEKLHSKLSFYRSLDGSRIPISILSASKNQKNKPLLMLVASEINTKDNYHYSSLLRSFIELGGSVAIPHIRGSSTYGNSWTKAGSGKNIQNAIDDIVSAQKWLIDKNFTSSDKFAIYSNGNYSLAFAQALNLDSFKVSTAIFSNSKLNFIAELPSFTEQDSLLEKYGYNNTKETLNNLLEIDPYTNINSKDYPAILIISKKSEIGSKQYLAKLQNHQFQNHPMLMTWSDDDNEIIKTNKILFFLRTQLKL